MKRFEAVDNKRLWSEVQSFEKTWREEPRAVREEYLGFVLSGRYARTVVQLMQDVLEACRPCPTTFADFEDLLAYLETLNFRLSCLVPARPPAEETAWWRNWEKHQIALIRSQWPRAVQECYVNSLVASIPQAQQTRVFQGGPAQRLLSSVLGEGDDLTAAKVAMRMLSEGVDGGVRRLRHLVAVAIFRRHIQGALEVIDRFLRDAINRDDDHGVPLGEMAAGIIGRSGLVAQKPDGTHVLIFRQQYLEKFVETISNAYVPADFS